jgi:hypothetical protein
MPVNINEDSQLPSYNTLQFLGSDKIPFIVLLVIIIVVYIFLFAFLNNASINNENNKWWILILEIILILILIVVVALNIDSIVNNEYSFSTEIKNLFSTKQTEITIVANDDISHNEVTTTDTTCKEKKEEGEVFHIYNNKYTYEDAREICSTLDARLATYDEVEDAYNKGGGWCSYGWSEDQLALFPTQKDVYNKLKTIPKHRNNCGRPGVNGGYIENKKFKFGVNCYGKKPYNKASEDFMKNYSFIPAISEQKWTDISNGKVKEDTIMNMLFAPFNKNDWNEPE